jgi:16S rRNA (uracil1498-N3)-methyltransferase
VTTPPLFLVDPAALAGAGPGDRLELTGDEGRHAATVRRLRVDEVLDVADGAGRRARCRVTAVGRAQLDLRVQAVTDEPAPAVRLVLVQALAKGGRDEQAVEAATELGVDLVVPWQAGRSVSVWAGDRRAKGRAKWQHQVREAAKQARRARLPEVAEPVDTAGLAALVRDAARTLLLDGEVPQGLADRLAADGGPPEQGDLLVVVGPEGGIAPDELAVLTAAGGLPTRLGPDVLRSSSAGPAALAVLAALLRW